MPASLMLRRLGSYPRQNGVALALREVGRIERTLFTLDWLEDPALRRQATAELNKGESRNALARAVCFHRLGGSVTAHEKVNSIGPAASTCSSPRSSFGTPSVGSHLGVRMSNFAPNKPSNWVFLKLCGGRLDYLVGGRYPRACEQNQIGPRARRTSCRRRTGRGLLVGLGRWGGQWLLSRMWRPVNAPARLA